MRKNDSNLPTEFRVSGRETVKKSINNAVKNDSQHVEFAQKKVKVKKSEKMQQQEN